MCVSVYIYMYGGCRANAYLTHQYCRVTFHDPAEDLEMKINLKHRGRSVCYGFSGLGGELRYLGLSLSMVLVSSRSFVSSKASCDQH